MKICLDEDRIAEPDCEGNHDVAEVSAETPLGIVTLEDATGQAWHLGVLVGPLAHRTPVGENGSMSTSQLIADGARVTAFRVVER